MEGQVANPRDQQGLTLVEVIVSLMVLTIGILGVIAVLYKSSIFLEDTHLHSIACFAAEEKINEVAMGIDWTTGNRVGITDLHDKYFKVPGLELKALAGDPPGIDVGHVWIETLDKIYQVKITILWNPANSDIARHKYIFETALPKR